MPNYFEYTTVKDVRDAYMGIVSNGDDALLLDLIRSVSRDMNSAARMNFAPTIETRLYDVPGGGSSVAYGGYMSRAQLERSGGQGADLFLDAPLLAVTTLTNGDGTTISSGNYWILPNNTYPKHQIRLKPNTVFQTASDGTSEQALALAGIWGYHEDYANAWLSVDTLAAAVTDTTGATLTLTTDSSLKAGQLIKIDSEYLYVSLMAGTSPTVVRGVNGSTAATHLINAPIAVWTIDPALEQLAREAVAARYRLRSNPIAETSVLDGQSFATPKDVSVYIGKRLSALGFTREQFA